MIVLLFDIDGTLINGAGAGAAALRAAFTRAFGVPQPQDVPFSGRTDRAIGRDMFAVHSLEDSAENWSRLRQEYVAQLPDFLPRHPGCVLPGIHELLARVSRPDEIGLGLLTGNVQAGAVAKLKHYGLSQYFTFGGYGDEHLDRNHVAESALSEARQHLGRDVEPATDVWVIGDTPLDIRCARWIKAKVLAVATGIHPREELASFQPDVLLDDLSDTDRVLHSLL